MLVGLPPKDLLEDVAKAWRAAGMNVDECFKNAVSVTGEWTYTPGDGPIADRITPKWSSEQTIPLKSRTIAEVLNPQPQASTVIHNLLDWIDRVDLASQRGSPRPAFMTLNGEDIFPRKNKGANIVARRRGA